MVAWIADDVRVSFLFAPPSRPLDVHSVNGRVSTLYLLRRELLDTLGHDPNVTSEADAAARGVQHRVLASSMLMLTVLDLLAKFAYGDARGEVGQRFKRLLTEPDGAALPPDQAEVFWRVRNSLVHAFGLPHEEECTALGLRGIGAWRRHPIYPDVFAEINDGHAVLFVDGVYALVLRLIQRSHEAMQRAPTVPRFVDMFDKYGAVFFAHG